MLSQIVYDFEAAHQNGDVPRLQDFVPPDAANRTAVVAELARIDLEYRRKRGLPIRLDGYLVPFPELAHDEVLLLELIEAESRDRQQRGEQPAADYAQRFPALAERLAAPTHGPAGSALATPPPPAGLPQVPGYEILSVLGQGGMGVVYQARDLALKRTVALKMIRAGCERSAEALGRFRDEAESVARLDHPHIVRILTSGEHQGQPYFVMEHIEGGSLAARLRGQPQSPHDSARLILLLTRAVHAAHQKGVIHRDLKPANVLLAPPAEEPALNSAYGCPRITDFGLAKLVKDSAGLTVTGTVLGTPCYMAPEQAEGRTDDVGPATDVWALGAILYELLTGRPPFQAATALLMLEQVCTRPPAPPSKLNPRTPRDLERICLRCLAKAPCDRYVTAAALAEDLARFLDGKPVEAPPLLRDRRRAAWRWGAAAALAALCGGLVWALWPTAAPGPGYVAEGLSTALKGSLDVQVSEPGNPRRQGLWLNDAGALPFQGEDEICIVVELIRPAYLYLLWIDARGKVQPVYPWRNGHWEERPAKEEPVRKVRLPDAADEFYPMKKGVAGMETLVLLARDTPLPDTVDLRRELADLPAQQEKDLRARIWFEDGRIVRDDPQRDPRLDARRKGHPVLQVQERIRQLQMRHGFVYSRAVSFANRGQ